jgi:hypothetical protein
MTAKRRSHTPSMPAGTVTFLLTDIEGSSELWETQRDAMQTSLARHDALLRQSIEAHSGTVVKTLGDGFLAAFATATDAVRAALAARVLGLALVQHARGHGEESDAALQELIDKTAETSAFQIAEAYAYRAEADRAFEWLERAYVQPDPGLTQIKQFPLFRNLHGDPRRRPFLEKMGLADVRSPG